MKKPAILFMIIAITVSLMGLVGIQVYWIRNAITMQEINFDRGVSEATSRAIFRFNQAQVKNQLMLRQEMNHHLGRYYQMLDSLNHLHYNKIIGDLYEHFESADPAMPFGQELSVENNRNRTRRDILNFDTSFVNNSGDSFVISGYMAGSRMNTNESPFQTFFDRSRFINALFDEMFSQHNTLQPTSSESIEVLDTLLYEELKNQGINLGFDFAIFNPNFNAIIGGKNEKNSNALLQTPYVFNLYPNSLFSNSEYLLLYFPGQSNYLLSQTSAMLVTSSLFILVVISSFGFTIYTVIKQKKLSVMKTDFINNMTHELKTPISTISLACQALKDEDVRKSEDVYQIYIKMIDEENSRLGLMTEKVLQTAVIERGKLMMHKTELDIHELLNDVISKVSLQIGAKNGNIVAHFNADKHTLNADKLHLTNVFVNLLDNAIKYTPISPHIIISTENIHNCIAVHVEDNGIGISRANQKKVFENLYRVHTGNVHNVKGFGLGLWYVNAIVQKHGGKVSLQSELKKGSKFTVVLPYHSHNEITNTQ